MTNPEGNQGDYYLPHNPGDDTFAQAKLRAEIRAEQTATPDFTKDGVTMLDLAIRQRRINDRANSTPPSHPATPENIVQVAADRLQDDIDGSAEETEQNEGEQHD